MEQQTAERIPILRGLKVAGETLEEYRGTEGTAGSPRAGDEREEKHWIHCGALDCFFPVISDLGIVLFNPL